MAEFTITIPDDKVQQLIQDFADFYGYEEEIPSENVADSGGLPTQVLIPNPESKAAFAKRMITNQIKRIWREARYAEVEAQKESVEQVDIDVA